MMSADHNDSAAVKSLGYLALAIIVAVAAFAFYF